MAVINLFLWSANSQQKSGLLTPRQGQLAYVRPKHGLKRRLKDGELKGKLLVCWCCPDACHGDVLLERAVILIGS
ncbi:DUF4326 domain-containing protein [Boseongicola aestuarii]|uniref:DUF4326 domain-containing protein n=1 Tax=Boseongicola aestuarii TaxID=1470561 RepID=UPI000B8E73A8